MAEEFTQEIGIEIAKFEKGEYVLELDIQERHHSMAGRAHGGVLFSMLDTAMGRAVILELPEGRGCATIEAKINYFRPVQTGRIFATARVPRMTRRTAYAEGVITDEEGNELARSSGTFLLTDSVRQADRERV